MAKKVIYLCVLLFLCPTIQVQTRSQSSLLRKAYKKKSTSLLYQFFDNWSNNVSSNENEAKNKWVAEAHKVFAAFYQPLQLDKIGCRSEDQGLYDNVPYFIVQGTLCGIYMADTIPISPDELEAYYANRISQMFPEESTRKQYLDWLRIDKERGELSPEFDFDTQGQRAIPTTKMDSNISFRPPVNFPNKKIVYLTAKYKRLLNGFLGNKHVGMGKEGIMQVAYSKGESRKNQQLQSKGRKEKSNLHLEEEHDVCRISAEIQSWKEDKDCQYQECEDSKESHQKAQEKAESLRPDQRIQEDQRQDLLW